MKQFIHSVIRRSGKHVWTSYLMSLQGLYWIDPGLNILDQSEKALKNFHSEGTWVPPSVKCPMLDFGSVHDLRVIRLSPTLGSMLSVEPAWNSPSPPSPLHPCALSHLKKKKKSEIAGSQKNCMHHFGSDHYMSFQGACPECHCSQRHVRAPDPHSAHTHCPSRPPPSAAPMPTAPPRLCCAPHVWSHLTAPRCWENNLIVVRIFFSFNEE